MSTEGLTAFLDFSHCFGAKAGIRDNVVHTSETMVAYPAGRHLCTYNTETRDMSFIVQAEHVESMTAMATSHNRKYIGVCERLTDGGGQVTIFNAASEKRVRTLTHPDCKFFTALAFSIDSKFLVTVGCAPEYTLVKRVSFSPLDNVQLATSGPGLLKLWRLQENTLKGFNMVSGKAAMQSFADHTWAPGERLLAATENGDVLVIEQGELRGTIKSRLSGETINTIACYSSGFIIAGSEARMSVYEKNDAKDRSEDRELYHHFKTFKTSDSLGEINSLSLSPGEENLAVFFSSNQVAIFPIASVDILKEEQNHFQFLGSGFHAGAVTAISVCVRKPLVATCGADRSVRIWNYLDKTCEVCKTFPDDISSIAIHPSGFHLLLGFSDKLRLFNVLIEDLRQYQEFPIKSCKQVKFSNGGHLFAAVNISNIIIYSTYTFEKLGVLISHTALVKSVCWSPDDLKLASAGIDGAVYEWSLQGYSRVEENVSRNVHYSCVVYNQTGSGVVACGDDRKITELIKSSTSRELNTPTSRVQQLLLTNGDKILIAGTMEGTVSAVVWGSEGVVKEGTPVAVAEGITALGVTKDDCILFVGTEDGMLFQFDIHLMEHGEVMGVTPEDPANFLDVVLVTRADMEEKTAAMSDLESKIGEIQVQSEYKLHLHDQDWNDKTKKMKEEMEAGRVAAEGRFEALRRRKEQQELEAVEAIQNMERAHMKAAEELESLYEKKLAIEAQRYRGLLHEKEDLECSYEEQLEITKSKYNSVILKLKGEYEAKTKEQQDGSAI
ncbi:WD40-repeat-containing domain protein [Baffinella frigidus]|nr:WD40-repeat-containing domain protein [Cryptophyta sp. CCMP2293]